MSCIGFVDHVFFLNFIIGAWDGLTAVISLAFSLFWDTQVYGVCYAKAWFYNLGFLIGIVIGIAVGLNNPLVLLVMLMIAAIVKLLLLLFVPLIWGVGIGIGLIVIVLIYNSFARRQPRTS